MASSGWRRNLLPSSWGTPIVRLPCSIDAGRTAGTRPVRYRSVAPGFGNARAPTLGLSTLNSMAFKLAVYASRCGLPHPRARLASGRWSGATGRAFHPQGSDERFLSASYISSPFPKPLGAIRNTAGPPDMPLVKRAGPGNCSRPQFGSSHFTAPCASGPLTSLSPGSRMNPVPAGAYHRPLPSWLP